MNLSDEELERYARHLVLKEVGGAGQARLRAGHVAIVGAGGIGAPVLLYLAAAGLGRLTIIDDDAVSRSNLQRQVLFQTDDVGAAKAELAAARVKAINPGVEVTLRRERIDAANAAALLSGADVVIDGTDNFATRLVVADTAHTLRIPLVSAAIGQFHGQVGTWRGYQEGRPCYRCFVGDAHDGDDCDTCAELGVLGAMTGILGSFAALEVIRALHHFGDDSAGKLHIFDGLAPAMRTIRIPKDPACRTCGVNSSS